MKLISTEVLTVLRLPNINIECDQRVMIYIILTVFQRDIKDMHSIILSAIVFVWGIHNPSSRDGQGQNRLYYADLKFSSVDLLLVSNKE